MAKRKDHSAIAIKYAEDVVAGKILAGEYVIAACDRFLKDLARKRRTKAFPWVYDAERANRACRFMELLPHTKGKWAAKRELLTFEAWQCFIECNIFGWVHKDTGLRRFLESYEEIARKNGKSIRLAARGLYLFVADGETGAEVYSGATTEKQAHEIFRPAWIMVNRTPLLQERFGIDQSGNAKNPRPMYVMSDMSRFETVIGKPGDGASPHAALVDEYHEHQTDDMVDTMQTGMGSREQPLLNIITTAGSNLSGPCYEKRKDVVKMLTGSYKNERLFGIIYSLDDDDDWTDPDLLIKANPNLGVSVNKDFLLQQLEQAKRSAIRQNSFRTKHLNQWVGARSVWMNMIAWQKQKRDLKLEDFKDPKYKCYMAVDLASKKDVAALILLFVDNENNYFVFPFLFVPEKAKEDNDRYKNYVLSGDLIETPGSMTDYAFIEEKIVELYRGFNVEDVAFDDWQANYLMSRLLERGSIEVVNYNQTVKNMSDPMKEVEAQVLAERLFHNGNAAMTWMMGNVTARTDAKENTYPRKENDSDPFCKIDGPVALIMAMGRAIVDREDPEREYQVVIV